MCWVFSVISVSCCYKALLFIYFHQIFKSHGLLLEIECNLKITNFLDITLNLNDGTYKPYRKPNDETIYIHSKSNHPKNIINQLPLSIESRLSKLSSNKNIFDESTKYYQENLTKCEYEHTITYQPNKIEHQAKRNRQRNIIWFNPPFSKTVTNNIGKYSLNLVEKHFPTNSKYRKFFNKTNLKISYLCMTNMKSIINSHNKIILKNDEKENKKCNCIKKEECPINNECLTTNIVYKANITSNLENQVP